MKTRKPTQTISDIGANILFRRMHKVILPKGSGSVSNAVVATIAKNIESLGFILSPELIERLATYSMEEIETVYGKLARSLKRLTGADRTWNPMYPNFPKQVIEMDEGELYLNAIMHYFGKFVLGVTWLPEYEKEERLPVLDTAKLKVVSLGTHEDILKMFTQLMESKTSISETDTDDLRWFLKNWEDSIDIPKITHKEVLSIVYSTLIARDLVDVDDAAKNFKTATDVLRLASALSDGDVSLAGNTRFRAFKRSERKFLLGILNNCKSDIVEDMLRHKNKWIRLGEKLHPGDYKKFKKVLEAFDIIRNKKPYLTFNSKVETALITGDTRAAAELLKKRPGDFARRLDHLLRISSAKKTIVKSFGSVADNVSSPVLLQIMTHFLSRNDHMGQRIFLPKGNVAKLQAVENNLPYIDEEVCLRVNDVCKKSLKKRYAKLPKLGKVYIDEDLKGYLVPFSQRSASKAMRTLVRGSKIDIPEGDTLRFFIHWKGSMIDVDLSGIMYDEDWSEIEHISYTNLKSEKYKAYHSGDITSAPRGAAEFIDIDMPSVLEAGGRYVIMSVLAYSQQPFGEIDDCFAGWMIRQHPNSGEIFEPKTVQDKIDMTSTAKVCVPIIFDLVERKMIWADLAISPNDGWVYNVEGNSNTISIMGKALNEMKKTSLYDLFELHALARGKLVKSPEKADVVFSTEDAFNIEKIMGEYL